MSPLLTELLCFDASRGQKIKNRPDNVLERILHKQARTYMDGLLDSTKSWTLEVRETEDGVGEDGTGGDVDCDRGWETDIADTGAG